MKFLVIAPSIEEPNARGIHRILFNILSVLRENGHEIYVLTGIPYTRQQNTYSLLKDKTVKTYLRYYFLKGRGLILSQKKTTILKQIIKGFVKGSQQIKNDDNLMAPEINFLKFVDYIVQQPYIHQFISRRKTWYSNPLINRAVKKYGIDIVLTGDPRDITISRSNKKKGVKLVQNVLDFLPLEGAYLGMDSYLLDFVKSTSAAIKKADHIITISEDTANKVRELREDVPVSILYSYVQFVDSEDITGFSDKEILKKFKVQSGKYFLYISALELRKNVDGIIEAFSFASNSLKSDLLIAGGKGFGFDKIEAMYKKQPKSLRKRIHIAGYVTDREKKVLMKHALAFVWASKGEGLGIPVMESMSLGTPVITSRLPTSEEIGRDSLHYIENPYKSEEIAQRMIEIESNKSLRKKLVSRYPEFNKKWTKKAYEERVLKFVADVTDGK